MSCRALHVQVQYVRRPFRIPSRHREELERETLTYSINGREITIKELEEIVARKRGVPWLRPGFHGAPALELGGQCKDAKYHLSLDG